MDQLWKQNVAKRAVLVSDDYSIAARVEISKNGFFRLSRVTDVTKGQPPIDRRNPANIWPRRDIGGLQLSGRFGQRLRQTIAHKLRDGSLCDYKSGRL